MNRSAFVALGFAGALALVAAPASAQHHRNGGGNDRGGEHRDHAAPRAESRQGRDFRSSQRTYAPRRFFRPYYAFRPRLNIGFGLWAGYPVTYYDSYYSPYESYPYATVQPGYARPPAGAVNERPEQTRMGGVSFQITPDTAEVWVDGSYVGTAGQFTPESQPLGLAAGRHRVEMREPGYDLSAFDVDIVAGQVIPYSGTLR